MKKTKIIITLFVLLSSFGYSYSCVLKSCDGTIIYSMDRYKDKILLRLDQYNATIQTMTKASKVLQKASLLKLKEYERLRERKKLELYKNIEIFHEINREI